MAAQISPFPTPVPTSDDPDNFDDRADDTVGHLNTFVDEANTLATEVNDNAVQVAADAVQVSADKATTQTLASSALSAPGTNGTSITSLTVGTGAKTFTTQTGKAWVPGQGFFLASSASPTNYMTGVLTAYNSGTGSATVEVDTVGGAGTFSAWNCGLAAGRPVPFASQSEAKAGALANVAVSALALTWAVFGTFDAMLFGDGSDGNVTVSGAVTLTRDMYYDTLTLAAGAALNPAGYRIFCKTALDLSNAPAGAIRRNGNDGTAGTDGLITSIPASGPAGAAALAAGDTMGASGAGGAGGGQNGAGVGVPGGSAGGANGLGGRGGAGSAGTNGTDTNGGALGSGGTVVDRALRLLSTVLAVGAQLISGGGGGGPGGGAGGATGVGVGGTGASGASGGGVIAIFARTIIRGASTAAGAIQAIGGNGKKGGDGNNNSVGAGGASGGGGGGFIYVVYRYLSGVAAAIFDVTGGNGGNGGVATAPRLSSNGAESGESGRVMLWDAGAGTMTLSARSAAVAGTAASGQTPGVGGTATVTRVSL